MRPRLYISWGGWLGIRAAELFSHAVLAAYSDQHASRFYSANTEKSSDWFDRNEREIDKASAAVILLTSDSLLSHWQAYEYGRLRGRDIRCTLLMVDVSPHALAGTLYAHLQCSSTEEGTLLDVIRAGFDAAGASEVSLGHKTEQDAVRDLAFQLTCLVDGLTSLRKYLNITGCTLNDAIDRNMHLELAVRGFCSAGLSKPDIAGKLMAHSVPAADYLPQLDDDAP